MSSTLNEETKKCNNIWKIKYSTTEQKTSGALQLDYKILKITH